MCVHGAGRYKPNTGSRRRRRSSLCHWIPSPYKQRFVPRSLFSARRLSWPEVMLASSSVSVPAWDPVWKSVSTWIRHRVSTSRNGFVHSEAMVKRLVSFAILFVSLFISMKGWFLFFSTVKTPLGLSSLLFWRQVASLVLSASDMCVQSILKPKTSPTTIAPIRHALPWHLVNVPSSHRVNVL